MHISFGENCLIDILLERYGLKTESFPFGAVRTNLEYNVEIIKEDFKNFLNIDNLSLEEISPKRFAPKNYYYNNSNKHDIFCKSSVSGLEFAHHNILTCEKDRQSYERKVQRFKDILLVEKNIIFWYHYRWSPKNNLEVLQEIFNNFLNSLNEQYQANFKALIISQSLEVTPDKIFDFEQKNNLNTLVCYDSQTWNGDDNVFAKSFYNNFDLIFNNFDLVNKVVN